MSLYSTIGNYGSSCFRWLGTCSLPPHCLSAVLPHDLLMPTHGRAGPYSEGCLFCRISEAQGMCLGLTRNPDWECSRKAMGGQIGGTAKSGGCGDCCTSERGCQRDPIATTHSVVLNTILLIRLNVKQTNHVSTCSSTPPHLPRHARSRPLSPTPPHGRQRLFFRRG